MIIAPAGFILKVSGSSMAMVAGGPRPGSTPTTVPRSTPMKHQSKLIGCSATPNPLAIPERISTLETEHAERQRHAERDLEHEIEADRVRQRHRQGDGEPPAVHHRHDEKRQQREA